MTLGEFPPFFRILSLGGVLQPPSDVAVLRKREEEEKEIQENNVHRNVKEATRLVGRWCCFFFQVVPQFGIAKLV